MGLKALHFIIFIGVSFGSGLVFAQTQGNIFSNEKRFQLFSNEYNYQEDLLSDIEPGQIRGIWRARLYGAKAQMETQSSEVAGMDVFVETKYKLVQNLDALVFFRGKFESGRSQDFFGDLEPSSGILLREAAMQYTPFSLLRIKAGVINQDWMNMPLLTSRQSFPGASGRISYPWTEKFETSYTGQYLIPTSQTLSTRTVGREATPEFVTHTVGANWKNAGFNLIADLSLYEFKNLPSYVAFESQKYGNATDFIGGPNNSAFKYDFKGWFGSLSGQYKLTDVIEPSASYSIIKNTKADATYNDGQIIGIGSKFHMENHILYVGYENFFAESDVAPAYYNSWVYGNTNSKGFGLDTYWQFKKHNFRIRAQVYKTHVINDNGLQQNEEYFYLGVETGYGKI